MTSAQQTSAFYSFGFAAQMRDADISQFRNWYDRTCLLPAAGRAATKASASRRRPKSASAWRPDRPDPAKFPHSSPSSPPRTPTGDSGAATCP